MSVATLKVLNFSVLAGTLSNPDIQKSEEKGLEDLRNLSDEALARQIQAGRRDLLGEFVRKHSDQLFSIIRRMVQPQSTAEDILQDTWIHVVRKFHQFDPSRPIKPWLFRIALNCCRDYWRRERLRNLWKHSVSFRRDGDWNTKHSVNSHKDIEDQIIVSRALSALSPKLREVVVLQFYSGLTHNEIAQVLRVPSGTVKSRLHFALHKLREHFNGKGERK